jgi:hypothetical protein
MIFLAIDETQGAQKQGMTVMPDAWLPPMSMTSQWDAMAPDVADLRRDYEARLRRLQCEGVDE